MLTGTKRDIENRLNLLSKGGVNEKVVDIFDRQTFCTIDERTELTKVDEHIKNGISRKQECRVKDKKSNKLNKGLLKEHENSIKKENKQFIYLNGLVFC
jgi:hypothetical protein